MSAPTSGPCGDWGITAQSVVECSGNAITEAQAAQALAFVLPVLFRLSGAQFPGECDRVIRPCFPAGTLVTTAEGQQPIEEVSPGTLVLTHKGRWRRVTDGGLTGYSRLVTVKGHGAALTATPEHKVLSSEIAAFERGRKQKLGAPEWTEASHLVGRAWAAPSVVAEAPDTPELPTALNWWIVGRWLGDGWTEGANSRSRPSRVSICCAHDEADDLESVLNGWRRYEQRTTVRFVVHDADARDWLRRWFGVGAAGKQIPGWVLGLPAECRRDLLDGYVSADGSRRPYGPGDDAEQIRCGTVSERLAVSIRLLAASLGHAASVGSRRQTTETIEGRKVSGQDWWSIEWITSPSRLVWSDEGDGRLWSRVRSVEESTQIEVPVYNLNVEEDHSYVASGVIVKNCYGSNCGCDDSLFGSWPYPEATWWWATEVGLYPSYPYRWEGEWFNTGCCAGRCNLPSVPLPGPIVSVSEVLLDGEVLDPSVYDVEGFRRLRRLDGGRWPCWQNLAADPETDDNTFQVSFTYGRNPGGDGIVAARSMAVQFADYICTGDANCLPDQVQSIDREGVTMDFLSPEQLLAALGDGGIGNRLVDIWLGSVNPKKLQRRATVRRLDQKRRNRARTWPTS